MKECLSCKKQYADRSRSVRRARTVCCHLEEQLQSLTMSAETEKLMVRHQDCIFPAVASR
jgi:hypothetical protein